MSKDKKQNIQDAGFKQAVENIGGLYKECNELLENIKTPEVTTRFTKN